MSTSHHHHSRHHDDPRTPGSLAFDIRVSNREALQQDAIAVEQAIWHNLIPLAQNIARSAERLRGSVVSQMEEDDDRVGELLAVNQRLMIDLEQGRTERDQAVAGEALAEHARDQATAIIGKLIDLAEHLKHTDSVYEEIDEARDFLQMLARMADEDLPEVNEA